MDPTLDTVFTYILIAAGVGFALSVVLWLMAKLGGQPAKGAGILMASSSLLYLGGGAAGAAMRVEADPVATVPGPDKPAEVVAPRQETVVDPPIDAGGAAESPPDLDLAEDPSEADPSEDSAGTDAETLGDAVPTPAVAEPSAADADPEPAADPVSRPKKKTKKKKTKKKKSQGTGADDDDDDDDGDDEPADKPVKPTKPATGIEKLDDDIQPVKKDKPALMDDSTPKLPDAPKPAKPPTPAKPKADETGDDTRSE